MLCCIENTCICCGLLRFGPELKLRCKVYIVFLLLVIVSEWKQSPFHLYVRSTVHFRRMSLVGGKL